MSPNELRASAVDPLGHSSVQPWSAGELFPGTITRVERYAEPRGDEPLAFRLIVECECAEYKGRSALFATYREAANWIRGQKAAVAESYCATYRPD